MPTRTLRFCRTFARPLKSRGSRDRGSEPRIPLAECCLQVVIDDLGPGLQQQVRPSCRPLHLLLLHHSLANHLVYRRLDKRRADRLAVPVAFTEVWNELLIVTDVSLEFTDALGQLPRGVRRFL